MTARLPAFAASKMPDRKNPFKPAQAECHALSSVLLILNGQGAQEESSGQGCFSYITQFLA